MDEELGLPRIRLRGRRAHQHERAAARLRSRPDPLRAVTSRTTTPALVSLPSRRRRCVGRSFPHKNPRRTAMTKRLKKSLAAVCGMFVVAAALAQISTSARAADPVTDFYTGKTVQLVIGYAPGG